MDALAEERGGVQGKGKGKGLQGSRQETALGSITPYRIAWLQLTQLNPQTHRRASHGGH